MEGEPVATNDAIFNACPVCSALPFDKCELFSEFCCKIAKTGSLTQVLVEGTKALPTFCTTKDVQSFSTHLDELGVRHHVMHCLGTREPAITRLITTNVVMVTMMKSTDANKSLACAKLLLQSVNCEARA